MPSMLKLFRDWLGYDPLEGAYSSDGDNFYNGGERGDGRNYFTAPDEWGVTWLWERDLPAPRKIRNVTALEELL